MCYFFQFIYESERNAHNKDILQDIKKGVRLKHVRTDDRSKPNLRGKESTFLELRTS